MICQQSIWWMAILALGATPAISQPTISTSPFIDSLRNYHSPSLESESHSPSQKARVKIQTPKRLANVSRPKSQIKRKLSANVSPDANPVKTMRPSSPMSPMSPLQPMYALPIVQLSPSNIEGQFSNPGSDDTHSISSSISDILPLDDVEALSVTVALDHLLSITQGISRNDLREIGNIAATNPVVTYGGLKLVSFQQFYQDLPIANAHSLVAVYQKFEVPLVQHSLVSNPQEVPPHLASWAVTLREVATMAIREVLRLTPRQIEILGLHMADDLAEDEPDRVEIAGTSIPTRSPKSLFSFLTTFSSPKGSPVEEEWEGDADEPSPTYGPPPSQAECHQVFVTSSRDSIITKPIDICPMYYHTPGTNNLDKVWEVRITTLENDYAVYTLMGDFIIRHAVRLNYDLDEGMARHSWSNMPLEHQTEFQHQLQAVMSYTYPPNPFPVFQDTVETVLEILGQLDFMDVLGLGDKSGTGSWGKFKLNDDYWSPDAPHRTTLWLPQDSVPPRFETGLYLQDGKVVDPAGLPDVIEFQLLLLLANRLVGGGQMRRVSRTSIRNPTECLASDEGRGVARGWSKALTLLFNIKEGQKATDDVKLAAQLPTIFSASTATPTGSDSSFQNFRMPVSTRHYIYPFTIENMQHPMNGVPGTLGDMWANVMFAVAWVFLEEEENEPVWYFRSGQKQAWRDFMRLALFAMQLTPCQPTVLHARDAVLFADSVLYEARHEDAIWDIFARHGMGVGLAKRANGHYIDDRTVPQ